MSYDSADLWMSTGRKGFFLLICIILIESPTIFVDFYVLLPTTCCRNEGDWRP